jgi:hypothetical protein
MAAVALSDDAAAELEALASIYGAEGPLKRVVANEVGWATQPVCHHRHAAHAPYPPARSWCFSWRCSHHLRPARAAAVALGCCG